MIHKPTRLDSEEVIRALANSYPKCFFEDPKLRRPLKHNILADLEKDGVPFARDLVVAAIEWYTGNVRYLYGLQAGSKRIDLNGVEVGTVSEQEYMNAQPALKAAQAAIKAAQQKRSAAETVAALHAAGRLSDDAVKKLDAPMIPKATKAIAPELAKLHEAIMTANATLSGPGDENLRLAMAVAALGFVCKEAQRVIASLNHQPDESAAKGTAQ
jgi:sRNA-binding protein